MFDNSRCDVNPTKHGDHWQGYGVYRHFQQYFSYIVSVSFIGVGNRSSRKKHRPDVNHRQTIT